LGTFKMRIFEGWILKVFKLIGIGSVGFSLIFLNMSLIPQISSIYTRGIIAISIILIHFSIYYFTAKVIIEKKEKENVFNS